MTYRLYQLLIVFYSLVFGNADGQDKNDYSLKKVFEENFLIGAALNQSQISQRDSSAVRLIRQHFNSITAENAMKWQPIHPSPDIYNFDLADKFVAFGKSSDMFIIGHTLVWHNQIPGWVFLKEPGDNAFTDRQTLIKRIKEHIFTVVGRYKGVVRGWDVVNEAVDEDGSLRNSNFLKIAGEEYIQKAFEFAREADPDAELYYNDYNLWKPSKRDGVIRLVKDLQSKGVKVDGIGMQGHWSLGGPTLEQIEESILLFSQLGVKVMITELDISVLPSPQSIQGAEIGRRFENSPEIDPYKKELPDSVQRDLASRYHAIFNLLLKHHDKISRTTFWGVHDGQSWKNNWPVRGRTDYPLLFDRSYREKPAFFSVIEVSSRD